MMAAWLRAIFQCSGSGCSWNWITRRVLLSPFHLEPNTPPRFQSFPRDRTEWTTTKNPQSLPIIILFSPMSFLVAHSNGAANHHTSPPIHIITIPQQTMYDQLYLYKYPDKTGNASSQSGRVTSLLSRSIWRPVTLSDHRSGLEVVPNPQPLSPTPWNVRLPSQPPVTNRRMQRAQHPAPSTIGRL